MTLAATKLTALRESRQRGVQNRGKALNTRLTEQSQIKIWRTWTAKRGVFANPASPSDVVDFLYDQAEQGFKLGTLRQRVYGISALHGGKFAEYDPTKDESVFAAMKEIGNIIGEPQRQASPLDTDALEAIERTACNTRKRSNGRCESSWTAERRGLKDIALCYTLADCGLRVSEAANLEWQDVSEQDGIGLVLIRKSKTDQTGKGRVAALSAKGYAALLRYRDSESVHRSVEDTDSVFNLSRRHIGRRIGDIAKHAGLDGNYSGHSGRVGLAVQMTKDGFSAGEIMIQAGWKSANTVARYQRGISTQEIAKRLNR